MWQLLKSIFKRSKEEEELINNINKQAHRGWTFEVGPRGGIRKYYMYEKDMTPDKTGWKIITDEEREHFKKWWNENWCVKCSAVHILGGCNRID